MSSLSSLGQDVFGTTCHFPYTTRYMKILIPAAIILILGAGCSVPSSDEIAVQHAERLTQKQYDTWTREHAGGTPEATVEARFATVVEATGLPKSDFTYYDLDGTAHWKHASYVANQLNLNYEKLAYIQMYNGTFGIESTVAAMDQSSANVAVVLKTLVDYHAISDGDTSYFSDILTSAVTDEEKAAMILTRFADTYRVFFTPEPKLWGTNITLVNDLAALSALDIDNLTIVATQYGLEKVFALFPDTLSYKAAALTRLGDY